jgi:hypothetical protein
MVDRIDTNVSNAREWAEKARHDVEEAKKARDRAIWVSMLRRLLGWKKSTKRAEKCSLLNVFSILY